MRIRKYIHSCLLVESSDARLLFDPGKFSFLDGTVKPESFRDLTAIILTHQHPDHMDEQSLKTIVRQNRGAVVLANTQIREQLGASGIAVEIFESGTRKVGGCMLEAIVAQHAEILNAERPRNVAYVVDGRLLHPGDSFDHSLDVRKGIELLALPLMAPWNTELAVAEFALRLAPKTVFPIHDGYAKDFFLTSRYENFTKYFAKHDIEFVPLKEAGATLER
ncbi:MAG TPA: MBL fold metallo-hydrolase [Thermoanaerobaculia bacterium]|jgi:L-ascorbate metabolism protein UlaG (beta-lactamase superfamily)|nr:MBL fold metallo-hydrolase [Thermoanaerobaculia bacterium]